MELDSTSYNSGLSSLVRTWPLALELLAAARRVPSHIGPSTETTDSSGLNAAATALGEGHRCPGEEDREKVCCIHLEECTVYMYSSTHT